MTLTRISTFGQTTIERNYDGGWASTFWKFEFLKDGTFKWASRGHFGYKTKVGTYQIYNDTLEIKDGYQNTAGTINKYYLIEGDSCIVDIRLRYAYCVLDHTQQWQYEDERKREIKYPQKKTNNQQLILDLDSVLNLCFNLPVVIKNCNFNKYKNRQPAILEYYELNKKSLREFTIDNRKPTFISKATTPTGFYIEIKDINQEKDEIQIEFKIPQKPVTFMSGFHKVADKWTLWYINDYKL